MKNKTYICVESFFLPDIGENGEILETESEILKDSVWSRDSGLYRFCGAPDSVRLENAWKWIEISEERFAKHFAEILR